MPSTIPNTNWSQFMTLVTRFTVTFSSTSAWKPSFSSMVATGSRPPYGVKFLPRKSYGVEALILLGCGITSPTPCVPGSRRVCCFLLFTIWVAPENRSAKLRTSRISCFNAGFSGAPNGCPSSYLIRAASPTHNLGVKRLAHVLDRDHLIRAQSFIVNIDAQVHRPALGRVHNAHSAGR